MFAGFGRWPKGVWGPAGGGNAVDAVAVAEAAVYALGPYSWFEADGAHVSAGKTVQLFEKVNAGTGIRLIDPGHAYVQGNPALQPPEPAVRSGEFAGRPVLTTAISTLLQSTAPASAWSFLTNGATGATQVRFYNRFFSAFSNTLWMGSQDAFARSGGYDNNSVYPVAGAGNLNYHAIGAAATALAGTQPGDEPISDTLLLHVASAGSMAGEMYTRGALLNANPAIAAVAGPPASSMCVGSYQPGTGTGPVAIAMGIWFDRPLGATERAVVLNYGALKYGIAP